MVSDPIEQSIAFNNTHRIAEDQPILFGMRDGGRHLQFGNDGQPLGTPFREIVIARSPDEDRVLKAAIEMAVVTTSRFGSVLEKVDFLADYVAGLMSEAGMETAERNVRLLVAVGGTGQLAGVEISLGDLIAARTGVCRHRSLLFKIVAEACAIPCALVRGNYILPGVPPGGHAWNEVVLENGDRLVVDVMNNFVADLADPDLKDYADVEGGFFYRDAVLPGSLPRPFDDVPEEQWAALRTATWARAQAFSGRGAYTFIDRLEEPQRAALVGALDRLGVCYDIHGVSDGEGQRRQAVWIRGAYYILLARLGIELVPPLTPTAPQAD